MRNTIDGVNRQIIKLNGKEELKKQKVFQFQQREQIDDEEDHPWV